MSLIAHASSASSSSSSIHIHPQRRDDLWQMNLISMDQMEYVPYPVREGEPDCSYYIRTGFCRFGDTCRFNHPPDRNLVIVTARMKGEYPERIGQPECQYYLKTGTCKFGATCKFHHPRDQAGAAGGAILNVMGYPIRPNEVECAFYMRNGHCKFGSTCKFHHPQPSNMMVSVHSSALYPPIHSGSSEQSAQRVSFITGPQWQSPSSCAQLIMPQGVLPVPWNTQGEVGSVSPSENQQQQTAGNSQNTCTSIQVGSAHVGFQFGSNSLPVGNYAFERGSVFPERPGQPECQFYMKTGDCKFGATCKFHHPREGRIPVLNCVLSPIGLPLRPGEPLCIFYLQYGVCKFGPSCKFDHPMRAAAAFSSTDGTTFMQASSSGTVALSLPTNGTVVEASDSTKGRLLSLTEARQKPSEDNLNTEERRLVEVELPSAVEPANRPVWDTQR